MPTKTGLPTKREQKRLVTILKEDFHFDVVKEMIDLYHKVVRSRMPREKKYKFQFTMLAKIMDFALPKLRADEGSHDTGDQIQFNILVGGTQANPPLPGDQGTKQITIPTQVDPDGNYVIDIDKQK